MLNELSKLLKQLGLPPNIHGYNYVRYAVLTIMEDPNLVKMTDIYRHIAENFDVTPQNVEHCIRKGIETAFLRGDLDLFDEIFQFATDGNKGKPTNSEFIFTIYDYFITQYHPQLITSNLPTISASCQGKQVRN